MSKITSVFVYGTLKAGFRLDREAFKKLRTSVIPGSIPGSLFNLGWFPTIKLDGKGTVHGEVHSFPEDEFDDVLSMMDRIESYNSKEPKRGLYNRHVLDVKLDSGETVQAYAYEYNGSVGDDRRIESGEWKDPR